MKDPKKSLVRRDEKVFSSGQTFQWLFLTLLLSVAWTSTVAPQVMKIPLYIKQTEIWVEVAKTPQQRAIGLMGRDHLGKNEGMFFIFETEGFHSFWMKDTRIPLSIAFLDKGGKIVQITDMNPLTVEPHVPPKPILYALEMNKGWFSANGIKVGDIVRFSK